MRLDPRNTGGSAPFLARGTPPREDGPDLEATMPPLLTELCLRRHHAEKEVLEDKGLKNVENRRQLEKRMAETSNEHLLLRKNKRQCHNRHCTIGRDPLGGLSQPCHLTSDTDCSSPSPAPPDSPSSTAGSSTELPLRRMKADKQGLAVQQNMDTEGLVLARTSQSSTISYEGVYASGDGFGAELRKGAKRLRQDGFRSPLEAAQERAQWLRSREEGKGHAPAVAATGQEQLAAEALIDLVAAKGAAMAPAVAQLLASVAAEHSTHKGLWLAREPAGFEGVCTSRASFDAELRTGGSSSSWDEQLVQAGAALMISEEPMLNRRGAAPEQEMGSSKASTLEERFAAHVMCNYTPSPPGKLSKKRWVSCEQLLRQLQPHTSSAETLWEPAYAKQLVCDRFKNHPTFAGRSFSEWCKRLLNRDVSGGRNHVTCFSLEYTPG